MRSLLLLLGGAFAFFVAWVHAVSQSLGVTPSPDTAVTVPFTSLTSAAFWAPLFGEPILWGGIVVFMATIWYTARSVIGYIWVRVPYATLQRKVPEYAERLTTLHHALDTALRDALERTPPQGHRTDGWDGTIHIWNIRHRPFQATVRTRMSASTIAQDLLAQPGVQQACDRAIANATKGLFFWQRWCFVRVLEREHVSHTAPRYTAHQRLALAAQHNAP